MHWMALPKQEGGMGFHDLHCFNQAMLAKQCWRLLSDPDSLCVLRAKYYPDGDLINAQLKKGAFHMAEHHIGFKIFQTRLYFEASEWNQYQHMVEPLGSI
jgi:hypothetical protein